MVKLKEENYAQICDRKRISVFFSSVDLRQNCFYTEIDFSAKKHDPNKIFEAKGAVLTLRNLYYKITLL